MVGEMSKLVINKTVLKSVEFIYSNDKQANIRKLPLTKVLKANELKQVEYITVVGTFAIQLTRTIISQLITILSRNINWFQFQ